MDPKDLSALGGAVSAMIAAFSYWAKTRHDRRRATRTVLFYLLELHHVAHRVRAASSTFRSAKFLHEFGAAIQARGLVFNASETAAVLKQMEPALAAFGRKQLEATVAESSEEFTKALADLSKEDPVLAFRLRGRDQLMLMPQKVESFVSGNDASFHQAVSLRPTPAGSTRFLPALPSKILNSPYEQQPGDVTS